MGLTVTINGAGFYYHLGGSSLASAPWPKFNLKAYRLVANYQTASAALDLTLTQFLDPPPPRGGRRHAADRALRADRQPP